METFKDMVFSATLAAPFIAVAYYLAYIMQNGLV